MRLHALTRLLSPDRTGARGPLWGETLADDPFAATFAPRRWADIDDDELVFLAPTLAPPGRRDPIRLTRLLHAAAVRVQAAGPGVGADAGARAHLAAALARAQAALVDIDAPRGLDERDAALVAFAARLNPGYLDPAYACLHETGALCAWLGIVAGGRDALLPACLAGPLSEACDARAGDIAGEGLHGAAAAFADAVGRRRLRAAAGRAEARGAPVRVRGSASFAAALAGAAWPGSA